MEVSEVADALSGLPLGALRVLAKTGSTNTDAASWASEAAPDLSLVLADEQTAGRGRHGRSWSTPPGSALAFSLVLRPSKYINSPPDNGSWHLARHTALGALAVCQALHSLYSLQARIKWPNDVLLDGRKAAGVLADALWDGEQLSAIILGIGVNVKSASVPPVERVNYPAVCVESVADRPVERLQLLRQILIELLDWRGRLWERNFIQEWENRLAWRGEWVMVHNKPASSSPDQRLGRVLGLEDDGRLKLQDKNGEIFALSFGEIYPHTRHSILPL